MTQFCSVDVPFLGEKQYFLIFKPPSVFKRVQMSYFHKFLLPPNPRRQWYAGKPSPGRKKKIKRH
jgi:hypothetical protein